MFARAIPMFLGQVRRFFGSIMFNPRLKTALWLVKPCQTQFYIDPMRLPMRCRVVKNTHNPHTHTFMLLKNTKTKLRLLLWPCFCYLNNFILLFFFHVFIDFWLLKSVFVWLNAHLSHCFHRFFAAEIPHFRHQEPALLFRGHRRVGQQAGWGGQHRWEDRVTWQSWRANGCFIVIITIIKSNSC